MITTLAEGPSAPTGARHPFPRAGQGSWSSLLYYGQVNGGGGADKFRIKIWDKNGGAVVYDNQGEASDASDAATEIPGGGIAIQKN